MKLNRLAHHRNNPIPKAIRLVIVPVAVRKVAVNRPRNPAPVRMVRRLQPSRAARNPTSEVKVRPAINPAISRRQKPTGSAAKQEAGQGLNGEKKPGGNAGGAKQQASDSTSGNKQENPTDGGQAAGSQSSEGPSARGSGNPTTGGTQSTTDTNNTPPEEQDAMADEINKDYAQTD